MLIKNERTKRVLVFMEKEKKYFRIAAYLLAAFVLWTVGVKVIDVQQIGPAGSEVGFAVMNNAFNNLTGVNMNLYQWTDILSLIPFGLVGLFGLFGLVQWIRRKDILKVDADILALGVYYIVVLALFVLFQVVVINYRPVLIEDALEASYPSSTTVLVLCVIPSVILQFRYRLAKSVWKTVLILALMAFAAFMLVARLISGVHWLSDIIGGLLISSGLVMLYIAVFEKIQNAMVEAEE